MTTCLVTGGAGFIGHHLVARLVDEGWTVRVVDDFSTGRRENLRPAEGHIDVLDGSLVEPDVARRAVADVEFVFHQAARPSVPYSIEHPLATHHANTTATLNLLEAARAAGVRRLVYAASSSAYGNVAAEVKREDLAPAPLSPYAVQKLAGEYYCRAYAEVHGLETVCLRYFNVFGPGQRPDSPYAAVIPRFATRMLRGERPIVYGDGGQSRDFSFVANNVHANLLAARAPRVAGDVVNIACGRRTSLLDLVALFNRLLGTTIAPEFAPPRAGDVRHSLAALDRARDLLGYEPVVDLEEGLRRTLEWYRAQTSAG